MPTHSTEQLRRDAKRLKAAHDRGESSARQRVAAQLGARGDIKLADALHVIAREALFDSWPKLIEAAEAMGLDRASALQRLKVSLFQGQNDRVAALLAQHEGLAKGAFGLSCALYDRAEVARMLAEDPRLATRQLGPRTPILHLAYSRWIKARPELEADMLAVAEMLLAHGADVNDGTPAQPGGDHLLSALYGAIGHADNMVLGRWLLEHGADPNDGESLYHATELGHREGLRMLLEAGADPRGTNALFRAMDFNDHAAVKLLLAHGAQVNDFNSAEVGGEAPVVIPALHQAARRHCDARMAGLILAAGADPDALWKGATAYEMARVFGNDAVAAALEQAGAKTAISGAVRPLVDAVDGREGAFIDPAKLPAAFDDLLREMVHMPQALPQMRALVARGLPFDQPDRHEKITPTHVAGWCGLPEVLDWLLSLSPDLGHVNGYGGTLLSTILHGSENNPDRAGRDYIACLRLALDQGVALPRRMVEAAGRKDIAAFLSDWAKAHPGQMV